MNVPGAPDQPPAQPDEHLNGSPGHEQADPAAWSSAKARETVLYRAGDLPIAEALAPSVPGSGGDVIDAGAGRVSEPVHAAGTTSLDLLGSFNLGLAAAPAPMGIRTRRTAR